MAKKGHKASTLKISLKARPGRGRPPPAGRLTTLMEIKMSREFIYVLHYNKPDLRIIILMA
jgi:hypothetical protein